MAPEARPKVKIAFVYYSMYGHIKQLVDTAAKAIEDTYGHGVEVKTFTVQETLSDEILAKMHVPPRDPYIPVVKPKDLTEFDGTVWGIPTRYGRAVAQISALFDATGGLWATGALKHKLTIIITSTGSQNGGQETTAMSTMPFFVHHGMIYVPYGFTHTGMYTMDEARGGSPWGAGTFSANDGSRQPSPLELVLARDHGIDLVNVVSDFVIGRNQK